MATLKKATVEFDKNKENGRVCIGFLTEPLGRQGRLTLTAKSREEVESTLTREVFTWSNLFKVTGVPTCNSGYKWLEFKLDLRRANKPLEWSEEHYEDQIIRYVRHLCHFVKDRVDSIEEEEGFLRDKLPEVSKTVWFVEV